VERMRPARYLAGQTIVREGELSDALYILTRGTVSVFRRDPAGAEVEINALGPGDFFGEIGLLTGGERGATVRATSPVELLVLDRDGFRALVEGSQATSEHVNALMATRVADATARAGR